MNNRPARSLATLLSMLLAGVCLQFVAASSASAVECQMVGEGMSRHQYCTGLRHENLGSKFFKGTSSYFNGKKQNVDASIYINGVLKDKEADGNCTWLRIRAVNSYWPNGNVYSSKEWKVCGAGEKKILGITIDQAWTYEGTRVSVQHCQDFGSQKACSTFFERKIPVSS